MFKEHAYAFLIKLKILSSPLYELYTSLGWTHFPGTEGVQLSEVSLYYIFRLYRSALKLIIMETKHATQLKLHRP